MKTYQINLVSKKIILSCLAFCLLWQTGCSLFSETETETKAAKKVAERQESNGESTDEAKIIPAREKLQKAQTNLSSLEDEDNSEKIKAAAAIKKCSENRALSEKNNKNYNDPKTETFKQCQEAENLQTAYDKKVDAANDEIKRADKELQNLTTEKSSPAINPNNTESSSLPSWLVPLLGGLAGLSFLGVTGFLINRSSQKAKIEREATRQGFESISSKHSKLRQEIDQLKATAELFSKQLSEQRKEISTLKAKTADQRNYSEQSPPPLPSNFPAPAPQFPVTVENYLAKNANSAAFGKHDPLFGTLRETDGDGAFYLIRDAAISDDARYAVPRTKQFVTRDDFLYHYSSYYECADPAGGEVWIKKPATVRHTPDGWRLDARGELEVR